VPEPNRPPLARVDAGAPSTGLDDHVDDLENKSDPKNPCQRERVILEVDRYFPPPERDLASLAFASRRIFSYFSRNSSCCFRRMSM
jgi:hypothetical protein